MSQINQKQIRNLVSDLGSKQATSEKNQANGYAGLDANGLISLSQLPQGALERLVVVADQAARYALTTTNVQLGDTVKQVDTGLLYYVVDTTKLDQAEGYEVYVAGRAATADTVTNATFTTALTVNGGTLTLTADASNTSVLTIGAGAVSVSGSNTGDETADRIATLIAGATAKTPVVGADTVLISDSEAGGAAKKVSMTTIKAFVNALDKVQKVAKYAVTTAFTAGEVINLVDGTGATAGVTTTTGDYAGVALGASGAAMIADNTVEVLENGVEQEKGVDFIWDSATTGHFAIALDIGDRFTVKYFA